MRRLNGCNQRRGGRPGAMTTFARLLELRWATLHGLTETHGNQKTDCSGVIEHLPLSFRFTAKAFGSILVVSTVPTPTLT